MDDNFKVGNFICELRKSKGLSQAELGRRLNVTNKEVSRWETGRGLPDSSLLLPLAKELDVTVDEILRGEFFISEVEILECVPKSEDSSTKIKKLNTLMDYRGVKKQLIRDSLIVIPTFFFICVWLYIGLNPNIDFMPGADYTVSVFVNLIVPLTVVAIAQIIYAFFLITDSVRMQGRKLGMKILICFGIYYAVVHLFFAVYVFRIVRFFVLKKRMKKMDRIG